MAAPGRVGQPDGGCPRAETRAASAIPRHVILGGRGAAGLAPRTSCARSMARPGIRDLATADRPARPPSVRRWPPPWPSRGVPAVPCRCWRSEPAGSSRVRTPPSVSCLARCAVIVVSKPTARLVLPCPATGRPARPALVQRTAGAANLFSTSNAAVMDAFWPVRARRRQRGHCWPLPELRLALRRGKPTGAADARRGRALTSRPCAGAVVDYPELYRRLCPQYPSAAPLPQSWWRRSFQRPAGEQRPGSGKTCCSSLPVPWAGAGSPTLAGAQPAGGLNHPARRAPPGHRLSRRQRWWLVHGGPARPSGAGPSDA